MPVGVVMRDGKVRSSTGQHLNVAGTKGAWRPYIGLKVEFDLVPDKSNFDKDTVRDLRSAGRLSAAKITHVLGAQRPHAPKRRL